MLTYKRVFNRNNIMRYEFYPNGDTSAPGIIEFSAKKKAKIIQQSSCDVKMYYAVHAIQGIDTSKESGTVAWY